MGWGLTSSFGWLSDVLMEVDKLPIKECDISVSGIVCINPKNGKGVCQVIYKIISCIKINEYWVFNTNLHNCGQFLLAFNFLFPPPQQD